MSEVRQLIKLWFKIILFFIPLVIEPLIIVLMAFLSYSLAHNYGMSGIISITCCGLMQSEYSQYNISRKSYTAVKYMLKTMSSVSDVIIFFFVGFALVSDEHHWKSSFVIIVTLFCVSYRFVTVFCLSYISNHFSDRIRFITFDEQLLLAHGGLRGAIAFSLAFMLNENDIKHKSLYVTTTLFIILYTVTVRVCFSIFLEHLIWTNWILI